MTANNVVQFPRRPAVQSTPEAKVVTVGIRISNCPLLSPLPKIEATVTTTRRATTFCESRPLWATFSRAGGL
jgi:hypothetical protein